MKYYIIQEQAILKDWERVWMTDSLCWTLSGAIRKMRRISWKNPYIHYRVIKMGQEICTMRIDFKFDSNYMIDRLLIKGWGGIENG